MLYHRRSKRVNNWGFIRQLIILVGVFSLVAFAQPVHARDGSIIGIDNPLPETPLQQNEKAITDLKLTFEVKKDLIEDKKEDLEKVKKEAEEVAAVKQEIVSEVNSIKSEIEVLKAKVEEKKRLDALRIVQIAEYAPDSAGNNYAPGNCTWYAKSRRPDLPNSLGNAKTWYTYAKNSGFRTGTMAKKGAIGVSFAGYLGHVVYVESWNKDGTITISEMNAQGLYVTSTRLASETEFVYIYEKI